MAPQSPLDDNLVPMNATAVAVDKDKNSPYAVRWAIDHLVIRNPILVLIHVKKSSQSHSADAPRQGSHPDKKELFAPFNVYCARKGVELKEVVVHGTDICKTLLEYIHINYISNFVIGASARNAFARKFKSTDISSMMVKTAPDFCTVYVISKGKVVSIRQAQRSAATPPRLPCRRPPSSHSESDDETRVQAKKNAGALRDQSNIHHNRHLSMDHIDLPSNNHSNTEVDNSGSLAFGSMDFNEQNTDISSAPSSPRRKPVSASGTPRELEVEMRRIKLEIKQTMEMYNTACREAISAKQKANELHKWRAGEALRIEKLKEAEEMALAIVKKEKAKCEVAIEQAKAAQKLAEMEAEKRRHAELKAKHKIEEKKHAMSPFTKHDIYYRKYTIEEIEDATEKFSNKNKVGEGGYGPVFKGKIDHTPVAIKVLRPDAAQGRKQFQQEVEVLSCMRHPNMVLLLGACPEYGCLVYEFMDNGSLEDRLLQRGNSPPLSWRQRFKISAEIATALLFLHQAKPEPLVHRDLKPANILLDRNCVSKISDVGLARLVPPEVANNVTQYHMTSAAGTFCYIDPEYQQTGKLTTKSDIYSLGIMLLQIITAKPPMGLSHQVATAIDKGKFEHILDQAVLDWPIDEALSFARMAIRCTELKKKDRPDLGKEVLPELNRLRSIGIDYELESNGYYPYGHGSSNSSSSQSYGSYSSTSNLYSRISDTSQESGFMNTEEGTSI